MRGDGSLSEAEWRLLNGLYTSTTNFSGYGSVSNLIKASGLPKSKVLEYLKTSATYTKFKPVRRKFPRLKVVSYGIDEIWSGDLAFMDKLAKENDGVKYLFVCVDVLSRFTFVQSMKSKTAAAAKEAFQKMLRSTNGRRPQKLWVDQGTEFSGVFKRFCTEQGIETYSTYSEVKSVMAERYIRSLKSIIYKYMEERKTYRYIGQLQNFVKLMNSRVNRATSIAPVDVRPEHSEYLISLKLQNLHLPDEGDNSAGREKKIKPKFKVGDTVRISKKFMPFHKGYKPQFTDEVFTITHICNTRQPITYRIRDVNRQPILGRFYAQELVPFRFRIAESSRRARHQTLVLSQTHP